MNSQPSSQHQPSRSITLSAVGDAASRRSQRSQGAIGSPQCLRSCLCHPVLLVGFAKRAASVHFGPFSAFSRHRAGRKLHTMPSERPAVRDPLFLVYCTAQHGRVLRLLLQRTRSNRQHCRQGRAAQSRLHTQQLHYAAASGPGVGGAGATTQGPG